MVLFMKNTCGMELITFVVIYFIICVFLLVNILFLIILFKHKIISKNAMIMIKSETIVSIIILLLYICKILKEDKILHKQYWFIAYLHCYLWDKSEIILFKRNQVKYIGSNFFRQISLHCFTILL